MTERGEPEVALIPAPQTVGERIRLVRTRCKLSQSDVAHALRVTKACVSSWEVGRNEISVGELTRLADFFGVQPSTLIDRSDGVQTEALDVKSLAQAIELSERVDPARFAALTAQGKAKVLAFIYAQERAPTPGEVRSLVSIVGDC